MRKALSLIELIFTIVIIALVFTVIPKVVLSLNKADSFVIRQDALFNGASMVNMISKLPWDEANTNSVDILHTNSSSFTCSTSNFMRNGSFIGSRNCEHNLTASLGNDGETSYEAYNDFDDYTNENNITSSPYKLDTNVTYITDNYTYAGQSMTIDLNASAISPTSTNLKKLNLRVDYVGKRGKQRQLTQFEYVSSNIGQMILHKRTW